MDWLSLAPYYSWRVRSAGPAEHRPSYLARASGLRESGEHIENQWLALKIESFRIARGLIEFLPYARKPIEPFAPLLSAPEALRKPAVYNVDESLEARQVGRMEPVTQGMERLPVENRQAFQN